MELPPDSFVMDLASCARCGNRHEGMRYFVFERKSIDVGALSFTHWAQCPVLREPVLYCTVKT